MTLNDQISEKAQQTRQEAVSFENALAAQFRELTTKSEDNLKQITKQVDLHKDVTEKENAIANEVSIISAMFSKNALLENLVYAKIQEKLSVFPKKTEEDEVKEPTVTPAPEVPKKKKKKPSFSFPSIPFFSRKPKVASPPKSMASGGVVAGSGKIGQEVKQNLSIPYTDIIQTSIESSGLGAVSTLSQFIRGTESLSGFLSPYYKGVIEPFALSLGVKKDTLSSLLGSPLHASVLGLKQHQKYFGMLWGKFLNDPDFVDKYIDREAEGDPNDPDRPPGYVPAEWDQDPEFVEAVNDFAKRYKLSAPGLLALMARESGLDPKSENSESHAVGLIQILDPEAYGTTKEALKKMTRKEQMVYVEKYLIKNGVKEGMTPADIYALVYLPGRYADRAKGSYGSAERMSTVLTVAGEDYYESNSGLDHNQDDKTTLYDLHEELKATAKEFKIKGFARGGPIQKPIPFSVIYGPMTGYSVSFDMGGPSFIGHGLEIIEGDKVFPVETPAYNIFTDTKKTFARWVEIYYDKPSLNVQTALELVSATEDTLKPKTIVNVIPSKTSNSNMISTSNSSTIISKSLPKFNAKQFKNQHHLLTIG